MNRGALGRLAIAITLACATVATITWVVLDGTAEPLAIDQRILVRDGSRVWLSGGSDEWAMRWRFAQPLGDLHSPQVDLEYGTGEWAWNGERGWCELSTSARTGALAVGWPLPWIAWRFAATDPAQAFPPSPEVADGVQGMAEAAQRVLSGEGSLVWDGALMATLGTTVLVGTALCYLALGLAARSRQAAAAPSTQTGTSRRPALPWQRST